MAKRRSDPDYLVNQTLAQRAWAARNPGYWKQYRLDHPAYVTRNRLLQHDRNERRKDGNGSAVVAKMDASTPNGMLETGRYELRRIDGAPLAKMNAWIVRLTVLSPTARSMPAKP